MTVTTRPEPGDARLSGLPGVGSLPWGSHGAHFYKSKDDLLETLVPYFRAGLEQNERCLWITSRPLTGAEANEALGRVVPDLAERIRLGQIEILERGDAGHVGEPCRGELLDLWSTREDDGTANGYEGLRVGALSSGLAPGDGEGLAAYEAAFHGASRRRRVVALCSYDLESCDPDRMIDILSHHGFALARRAGAWEVVRSATVMLATVERGAGDDEALADLDEREPAHAHAVRFYDDDAYPADLIAADIEAAVRIGAAAFVFATRSHLYEISTALRRRGTDVAEKLESGQLVMRDARQLRESIVIDGAARRDAFDSHIATPIGRAIARYGRVQAYGEIVDVLARDGDGASAVRLERWWNELLMDRPVELLCGYALGSFASADQSAVFRHVCGEHATVEPVEQPGADLGRVLAELQQSTAALRTEAERRQALEDQRNRLRESELAQRNRAQTLADHLARLQQFTSALSEAASAEAIARVVVTDLTAIFAAERVVVSFEDGGDLVAFGSLDGGGAVIAVDPAQPLLSVHRSGVALWRTSPTEVVGGPPESAAWDPGPGATWCLPVAVAGRQLGAVELTFSTRRSPSTHDRALLEDCARQVALALDRARSFDEARKANRAKDEFLAMLSHELRNPLAPILTAVQLMRLRAAGLLVKERTIIERQVNHMVRLIDDLLDVSRIARGTVQLKRGPIELAQVVANSIEIASPLLEERTHKLVASVPSAGLLVHADPSRLAQVIVNLLANSARYTPANGLIEIAAAARDDRVVVSVRDSGVGIDPDLMPRIFDMFVQGNQASDRPQGGLGLGLAIARNLIQMHGGTLVAESAGRGMGSIFTIELPRVVLSPGAATNGPASRARGDERSRRILVVDDNVDAASLFRETLAAVGHDVRMAHDGPSALEVAVEFAPELALVDLGLPVMDGYELARRLAHRLGDARPRLIAVTGYGQETDFERSRSAGFEDHLVKPVDLDRLRAVIERPSPAR